MKTTFERISRRQIFLIGLLLLGAGLKANEWVLTKLLSTDGVLEPRNVVIIWLFDVVAIIFGSILLISRSFGLLIEVMIGLGLTILLVFLAEKVFYRLNNPSPDTATAAISALPVPYQEGSYTQNFFEADEVLGYIPRANVEVDSIKRTTDEMIYDVKYTIDNYHRRVTPVDGKLDRSKFILFFGGSFVFGEGVNDDETLAYHVGNLAPDYHPYNYGLSGYGPQQMLAKLQNDELASEVPQNEGKVIYVFIDGHVERAIGSMYVYNAWGNAMPYYKLDREGNLVRIRDFRTGRPLLSTLYSVLGKSEIARYFNVNIPPRLADSHYAFTARIIAQARDVFKSRYGNDEFYVLIYPDEGDYFEDMLPHFEKFDLNVLNYDERMKLNPDEGLSIAGDGHPTSMAHNIVAGWIVEDLDMN